MSTRSLIAAGSAYRVKRRNAIAKQRLAGTVVLFALIAMASFPTTSFGAVTIGSDLAAAADSAVTYEVSSTLSQFSLAGRQTTSPINGVVVRWRIKTDGGSPFSPFTPRVVQPGSGIGSGVASGAPMTPAAGAIVHTFDTRLPIKTGQAIGIDQGPFTGGAIGIFYMNSAITPGSALLAAWAPAVPNGVTQPLNDSVNSLELLVNADIEPDPDGDGFGNETQDRCAADPVPAGGPCTPPTLVLGGKKTQRVLRQRGVLVEIGCPTEVCSANAKGTVAVPGAAKVYKLRPVTQQIPAGGKAKLKLKFAKKTFKAVKRALRKRKKIKAKVTVTATDVARNATSKKRTIKLKR